MRERRASEAEARDAMGSVLVISVIDIFALPLTSEHAEGQDTLWQRMNRMEIDRAKDCLFGHADRCFSVLQTKCTCQSWDVSIKTELCRCRDAVCCPCVVVLVNVTLTTHVPFTAMLNTNSVHGTWTSSVLSSTAPTDQK